MDENNELKKNLYSYLINFLHLEQSENISEKKMNMFFDSLQFVKLIVNLEIEFDISLEDDVLIWSTQMSVDTFIDQIAAMVTT